MRFIIILILLVFICYGGMRASSVRPGPPNSITQPDTPRLYCVNEPEREPVDEVEPEPEIIGVIPGEIEPQEEYPGPDLSDVVSVVDTGEEIFECPICHEGGDGCVTLHQHLPPEYQHRFHTHCILEWVERNQQNPTCPLCRLNLSRVEIAEMRGDPMHPLWRRFHNWMLCCTNEITRGGARRP